MREKIMDLFGVDIMINDIFKSIYQIFDELSQKWQETIEDTNIKARIDSMHKKILFKLQMIPSFSI